MGTRRAVLQTWGVFEAEASQPFEDSALGDAKICGHFGHWLPQQSNAPDDLGSTRRCEFGVTVNVHAEVAVGEVLLSQLHLPNSSPHEQPPETSHLEASGVRGG